MNQKASNQPEHGFNSFVLGLTLGVLGALLLGTEEGRKITKQAIDALPDSLKKIPDTLTPKEHVSDFNPPLTTREETPHHVYAQKEAPPPPPPSTTNELPEYYVSSR